MARPAIQTADLYTVVEQAGYVGEADQRSFESYLDACKWKDRHYTKAELGYFEDEKSLQVCIRLDKADGEQTYDF